MSSIRPKDSWSTTTPGHGPSPTGGTARWASSSAALAPPGMVIAGMTGSSRARGRAHHRGYTPRMGEPAHSPRLFPALEAPPRRPALRLGDAPLDYEALRGAALAVARDVAGAARVAVWAEPRLETAVAVTGALLAGVAAVPVNPKSGERELAHVVEDSGPEAVLAPPRGELPRPPPPLSPRDVAPSPPAPGGPPAQPGPPAPPLVRYTPGPNRA